MKQPRSTFHLSFLSDGNRVREASSMANRKLNPEAPSYYPLYLKHRSFFSILPQEQPFPVPHVSPPPHPPRFSLLPPPAVEKSAPPGRIELFNSAHRGRNFRGRRGASSGVSRLRGNWNPRFGDRDKFQMLRRSNRGGVRLAKHDVLPLSDATSVTTVMIKNIPKNYNRKTLLKLLDDHCVKENSKKELAGDASVVTSYDFVYFPADFSTGNSRGYAFVNFTDRRAVWRFNEVFNETEWGCKIVQIARAAIQGKAALVKHFETSVFRCGSDELLPVRFRPPRDGRAAVEEIVVGKRETPPPAPPRQPLLLRPPCL